MCSSSLSRHHQVKYLQIPYKHLMKKEKEEDGNMEGREGGWWEGGKKGEEIAREGRRTEGERREKGPKF